jgi:hypothetical protein
MSTAADTTFLPAAAGDYLGCSVAGLGDLDNDGYDDIALGAIGNDAAGADAGAAYVVPGPFTTATFGMGSAAATLLGESAGDGAGAGVEGNFDLDGDGQGEVYVSSPFRDAGATDAGRGYILAGPLSGTISLSSSDVTFTTATASDYGTYFSAGDLDADGNDDAAFGAYGSGRFFVFYGTGM